MVRVQKRHLLLACMVSVAIGWFAVFSIPTRAGNQTPVAPAPSHPLIGSWRVEVGLGMAGSNGAFFMFHPDGTVLATDDQGRTWIGSWEQTGERSAQYLLLLAGPSPDGASEGVAFVGHAEVDSTGNHFDLFSGISHGSNISGDRIMAH